MSNLLFPNKHRKSRPKESSVTEEDIQTQQNRETKKIKEHIDLLEKEKALEEERDRRIKRKTRKMNEAQVRKAIRKKQAIAMRMRNIPIDIIADRLGVTQSYAANLIREAVAELPEETAEDLKKLLGRTVIRLIGNFEKTALQGGVREAEVMLKGITQLMRLSGLSIQRREVQQTNMEVGNISPGIDVADLNLDLETKKKLLLAIRDSKKITEDLNNEKSQKNEDEPEDDGDDTDEEANAI